MACADGHMVIFAACSFGFQQRVAAPSPLHPIFGQWMPISSAVLSENWPAPNRFTLHSSMSGEPDGITGYTSGLSRTARIGQHR